MKFRIGYKIALFAIVNIFIAIALMWAALYVARKYTVEQEHVDLRDESASRGWAVRDAIHRMQADVLSLSRELADESGAFADAAATEQRFAAMMEDSGYLRLAVVAPGDDTSPRAETVAENVELTPEAQQAEREFLSRIAHERPRSLVLSKATPVAVQRNGETERVAVIWAAAPLPASMEEPAYVVAALNIEDSLAAVKASARHLLFVTQDEGFLVHPLWDGATEESATSARLPFDESPRLFQNHAKQTKPAREIPLAWGLEQYQEALANDNPEEQTGDRGVNIRGFEMKPGRSLYYQQSRPISLPENETAARQTQVAINAVLDDIRNQQDFREQFGPMTRVNQFNRGVGMLRVRAESDVELSALTDEITDRLGEAEIDVNWGDPIDLTDFSAHFWTVPYESIEGPTSLGLIQSVSPQEIKRSVTDALFDVGKWILWALAVFTIAALLSSFAVSNPLKRITEAAERFGGNDPRADPETWRKSVEDAKRLLPTGRRDEIGTLARTFEEMIDEISRSQEQLRSERNLLDDRVRERTAELEQQRNALEQVNSDLLVARDQAELAKKATDQFVASVSHELRTPLNHVMGFCQLLELSDLDEQQQQDLSKIAGGGRYLLALVNDILDYQRIVIGKVELESEEFDGQAFIEELGQSMRMDAAKRGNELVVRCDERIGNFYADRRRLKQILINLLNNACKFTEQGTVTFEATLEPGVDGTPENVLFQIADTGRGMGPEQQQRLFQPFSKLRDSQGNMEGTGLGLVISKGFCEMMGGTIAFESQPGVGTTFFVRLPTHIQGSIDGSPAPAIKAVTMQSARERQSSGPVENLATHIEPGSSNGSNVVLVVDDDANIRDLMRRFMEQRGFSIRTAASGEEGLALAKHLRPAAITVDVVMPGMDGWELLAALKTNEQTADIPVVMVTMWDDSRKGYALGVSDYIMKPIDWDVLAGTLRKYERGSGQVLLVEDDPNNRLMTRRTLENDGWTVIEAENGQVGLERLEETRPDLIILDLMMPVMDGFAFVEEVGHREDWAEIPVLVLTAKDPTAEDRRRLNGGVERILQKGSREHEDLLEAVHHQIEAKLRRRAPATL